MAEREKIEFPRSETAIKKKQENNRIQCRIILVHLPIPNAQDEVNNNSSEQGNGEDGRTESIIDTTLPAPTDTLRAPVECHEGIDHCAHSNDGEEACGDATDAITKVEKTDGEAAQDDGEVQP